MERMLRWREPAVVVVTVALLLRLVLVLVFTSTSRRLGLGRPADLASLGSQQLGEPAIFVVLALLVGSCWLRPATSHARVLTALALAVATVVVLVSVVLGLAGYSAYTAPFTAINLGARLVDLVVPVLAVLALALLMARPASAQPALPERESAADEGPQRQADPAPTTPDPELEPTWQPDVAAGAAWYTAGDAASGRPAAGWGRSDDAGGWQPAAVTTGREPADAARERAEPVRPRPEEDDEDEPEGWRPLP